MNADPHNSDAKVDAICPDWIRIANALQIQRLPERRDGALVKMLSKAVRLWAIGLTGISGKRCIVASTHFSWIVSRDSRSG